MIKYRIAMSKSEIIKNKKGLNPNDYVNVNTGEVMSSELSDGAKVVALEDSGLFKISSNNYITIDSRALRELRKILKKEEIGRVLIMSEDLQLEENVIFNKTRPHDNESLQEAVGFASKSMFLMFIKRMIEIGLIYKVIGNIEGYDCKYIYIMNPYFARKRKTFSEDLKTIFKKKFA